MSDSNMQHFEGTIEKITKDGERVMSSYLEEGERLASDVDAENSAKNARISAEERGQSGEEKDITTNSASGKSSKTSKG